MKKNLTVQEITNSEKVTLYSISFEMDGTTEFEKFVQTFENEGNFNRELSLVLAALSQILEKGALERFFRPEGQFSDNVHALPIDRCKLRLYCIRLTDEVVILGNGGVKSVKIYEEDDKLRGYVMDLQKFDKILQEFIAAGSISVIGRELQGIEDKSFGI